ncbi:MAG: DUF732 domain-containing protein [Mycobacteriaceae bacterium]|nr:DUF732 domain-containing protein [Mycobacteriaceae bacterium]
MTTVQLPADAAGRTTTSDPPDASAPAAPSALAQAPDNLVVSGQQRAYLDALGAAGVHPSSELLALSIGSYICQARAAGQSDQAVWDYVYPLVHNDVRNSRGNATAPSDNDVNAAAHNYVRIATERLC